MSMILGIGIGVGFDNNSGGGGAAPAAVPESLYASGESGSYYDPSDLSTLWQDSARTTAVTTDGDPVGCIDDLSGNGNHLIQTVTASKPTYKTSGGLHWLYCDGGDYLEVASSTALFEFMHDGTGGMCAMGIETAINTAGLIGNNFGSTVNNGFQLVHSGTTNVLNRAYNGTGTTAIDYGCANMPTNTATVLRVEIETRAGDDSETFQDGVSYASDEASAALATGAAQFDLNVMARGNGNAPTEGRLYGLILLDRIPTAGEADDIDQWLADRSGVTL